MSTSVSTSPPGRAMGRRSMMRGLAASVALLATRCDAPITVAPRSLRVGGFTSEALPADGSRPVLEQEVDEGLRDEGFMAGENITIEWRHAQGNPDLLPVFARELVGLPVDILIAATSQAALAAQSATSTIPIVMCGCGDPIDYGLIQTYARPGANVTGMAFSNTAEATKRLELLHEAFPAITRVTVMNGVGLVSSPVLLQELRRAADELGLQLSTPELRTNEEVAGALDRAGANDALLLIGSTLIFQNTPRIVSVASARRIPVAYSREEAVAAGGLLSYGSNRREIRLRVGSFVHRIAAGALPGDLSVELPRTYDLVVNLGTAQRAGFSLPASLLNRATAVIR